MLFDADVAYAMAQPGGDAGGGSMLTGLMPLFVIIMLFWFIILRPQQKKAKEHETFLKALKKGDNVVTSGGIHGKIAGIADNVLTIEIAPKVKIKINRAQITGLSEIKPDGSAEA